MFKEVNIIQRRYVSSLKHPALPMEERSVFFQTPGNVTAPMNAAVIHYGFRAAITSS